MKQEVKDIALQAAVSAPTSLTAWLSEVTLAEWLALLMFALQAAYLLRKWWREESEWGLKLRRWAERKGITKPSELDES